MKEKFRIEVEFSRRVAFLQAGPDAYTCSFITKEFPYGHGKFFKRSAEGIKKLEKALIPLLDKASKVSVTVWRGYAGTSQYFKNTEELFPLPFTDKDKGEFSGSLLENLRTYVSHQ